MCLCQSLVVVVVGFYRTANAARQLVDLDQIIIIIIIIVVVVIRFKLKQTTTASSQIETDCVSASVLE